MTVNNVVYKTQFNVVGSAQQNNKTVECLLQRTYEKLAATEANVELFKTLLEMQPKDSGGGGGGGMSMEDKVKSILDDIMEKLPDDFNLYELHQKVKFKIHVSPKLGYLFF